MLYGTQLDGIKGKMEKNIVYATQDEEEVSSKDVHIMDAGNLM